MGKREFFNAIQILLIVGAYGLAFKALEVNGTVATNSNRAMAQMREEQRVRSEAFRQEVLAEIKKGLEARTQPTGKMEDSDAQSASETPESSTKKSPKGNQTTSTDTSDERENGKNPAQDLIGRWIGTSWPLPPSLVIRKNGTWSGRIHDSPSGSGRWYVKDDLLHLVHEKGAQCFPTSQCKWAINDQGLLDFEFLNEDETVHPKSLMEPPYQYRRN